MRGYNDDLVMALAIACWVRDTALSANKKDIEYTKALMNSFAKSSIVMNTTIPGMTGHKAINKSKQIKQRQEHAWLFKG